MKHLNTKFNLNGSVISVASLTFMFITAKLYDFGSYVLWIPSLLTGLYIGLELRNKPNFLLNFIATFFISLLISIIVLFQLFIRLR